LVDLSIKPDWGPGKLLKVENGYAFVRFRDCGDRMAKKFGINDNPLSWATVQTDARLDEMTQDPVKKKRRPAVPARILDFNQALGFFQDRYPRAFSDPLYQGGPQAGGQYQVEELSRQFHASFGDGQLGKMVDNRGSRVIVERMLLILKDQDLLYRTELKSFKELLKDENQTLLYFKALSEVLEAGEVNHDWMNPYFEAVKAVQVPGFAKWPNTTLLPFLAQPNRHMLLKPQVAKGIAAMLGNPFIYEPQPNWRTYLTLLEMSAGYLKMLQPLGARDYLDVQSFFSVVYDGATEKAMV
jgi:hypothetical protein